MKLVFRAGIFEEIRKVVYDTTVETGVTLFGRKNGDERVVTAIAWPGPNATHAYADYSCDADYASDEFARLRREDPSVEWLGELHAHPPGIPFLSQRDLVTVTEILLGADKDAYRPDEFIAGVMLRRNGTVEIRPVHFTRSNLEGSEMELQHDGICQKPDGARPARAKAYRCCRSGQLRRHHPRHGRADGLRPGHDRGPGHGRD